jgi:hypothetical protein
VLKAKLNNASILGHTGFVPEQSCHRFLNTARGLYSGVGFDKAMLIYLTLLPFHAKVKLQTDALQ